MNIRVRGWWFIAALVLASLSQPCAAQTQNNGLRGLVITPLMFRNEVHTGTKIALPVEIQNLQQSLLTVRMELSSVQFDDWTYIPKFGDNHPHDCSSWFAVRQENRSVQTGAREVINLTATIPHVKQGVYWCMARLTPHFQDDPSTIFAQYQIPIILFIGHQPRPTLALGTPTLIADAGVPQIRVPFESTGEGFTVIGATVQLRQASTGRVIGNYFDSDRNLFPGTKRNLIFSPGDLPPGQYLVVSKAQAGARTFSPIVGHYTITKDGVRPTDKNEKFEMSPVQLDPGAIHLTMPAGGQRSAVVRVVNSSDKPISVKMLVRSLAQTPNGAFELGSDVPSGKLSVTADPEEVQIDPGRMAAVRLAVSGARDSSGDLWFGVKAQTNASNEIAEEIYGSVAIPGGTPKLELSQLMLRKNGQYPYSLRFAIKNTGTMSLKPIPFAQVLEQGLTPIATLQVPILGSGGVLPGSILENEVMLPPNLAPGAYTVNVKYQYGDSLFAELAVPITVPSVKSRKQGGK